MIKRSFEALRSKVSGSLVCYGNEGYEQARAGRIFNLRVANRYPAAILIAANESDVAAGVLAAKEMGLKVSVRSGGHNWMSSSIRDDSLLIDVKALDSIAVDVATGMAVAGPGCGGEALNRALEEYGLAYATGHCAGVSLGGFILGGGAGLNCNSVGASCGGVTAVDVVTADGEVVHATEEQHSEYLYLARGSGMAMKGVVTAFHLKCFPSARAAAWVHERRLESLGEGRHSCMLVTDIIFMGKGCIKETQKFGGLSLPNSCGNIPSVVTCSFYLQMDRTFKGDDLVEVAEWVRQLVEGGTVPRYAEVSVVFTHSPQPLKEAAGDTMAVLVVTAWADTPAAADAAFAPFADPPVSPAALAAPPQPTSYALMPGFIAKGYPGGKRWSADATGLEWSGVSDNGSNLGAATWEAMRAAFVEKSTPGFSHLLLCFFAPPDAATTAAAPAAVATNGATKPAVAAVADLPSRLFVNCYAVYEDAAEDDAQDTMVKAVLEPIFRLNNRAFMNESNLLWHGAAHLEGMFGGPESYAEFEKRRLQCDPERLFCDPLNSSDTF